MLSVETQGSLEGLNAEWDELAVRTEAAPCLHPGWIAAWWRAFGQGRLTVLAARDGGELVGVLPLARRAGGLASPTNWHTPFFGPVCASSEAAGALADALVRTAGPHFRLRFLSLDDPLLGPLAFATSRAGWAVATREIQHSPYVPIEGSWDEFRRGLSKDRRRSISRRERRLRELGEVTVTIEDGTERLDKLLSEGFALEASGWKGEQGTAILSKPETRAFYTDLCRWAAARQMLRLVFVRLDGRPIAFNLCLEDGRALYALKPGHSEEMTRYGPGALLIYRTIERAFELGLSSFELLGGQDDFKRSFAGDNCHARVEMQAFARSARGRAARLVQVRVRAAARRVLARSE